jgi:hypothetical protein
MAVVTTEPTEAAMAEWSDGRLDEFAIRVDERFDRADEKFDEKFMEVDRRFGEVARRFDRIDDREVREFGRMNDRLGDLAKLMAVGIVTLTGGILAGFAAILALIATQV